MLGIMRRRVYEAAATSGGGQTQVTLDGKRVKVGGIRDLAKLYAGRPLKQSDLCLARLDERWEVGLCLAPSAVGASCATRTSAPSLISATAHRRGTPSSPRRPLHPCLPVG